MTDLKAAERRQRWVKANPEKNRASKNKWDDANKEKRSAYAKIRYQKKKEAILANCKKYREANPEKRLATTAKWREDNKEKITAYAAKRHADNPARGLANCRKYQASKLNRTPVWANMGSINFFYECRPEGCHVDHVIPLQGKLVSGLHVENNLQWLPASENLSKGNRY